MPNQVYPQAMNAEVWVAVGLAVMPAVYLATAVWTIVDLTLQNDSLLGWQPEALQRVARRLLVVGSLGVATGVMLVTHAIHARGTVCGG